MKASKGRLVAQYLLDKASTYTRATVDGALAGQAFACRWEHDGKTVCWITQLVVHRDYRRQGLATSLLRELREDGDDMFGIMSSSPAACLAFANAYTSTLSYEHKAVSVPALTLSIFHRGGQPLLRQAARPRGPEGVARAICPGRGAQGHPLRRRRRGSRLGRG